MEKLTLMCKDAAVVSFAYDPSARRVAAVDQVHDLDAAPLAVWNERLAGIRDLDLVGVLNRWWSGRGIPASRIGFKEALRNLGAASSLDMTRAAFALSLHDQYWVKPAGSDLSWREVNCFENAFGDEIGEVLAGIRKAPLEAPLEIPSKSLALADSRPNSGTGGILQKMWTIAPDGTRLLRKAGSGALMQEPFNEAAACRLYARLLPENAFVPYGLEFIGGSAFSVCPCMVDADRELVSARDIFYSDPENVGSIDRAGMERAAEKLGIEGMPALVDRLIVLDFVIGNIDRHTGNFGAIRNVETRRFEGTAPLFDAGLSLLASDGHLPQDTEGIPSNPFASPQQSQLALAKDFSWFDTTRLHGVAEEMAGVLAQCPSRYMDAERLGFLEAFVESGIESVAAAANMEPSKPLAERAAAIRDARTASLKRRGYGPVLDPDAAGRKARGGCGMGSPRTRSHTSAAPRPAQRADCGSRSGEGARGRA